MTLFTEGWVLALFFYYPLLLVHSFLSLVNYLAARKKSVALNIVYFALLAIGLFWIYGYSHVPESGFDYFIFIFLSSSYLVPQAVGYVLSNRKSPAFAFISIPVLISMGIIYFMLGIISGKTPD